MPEKVVKHVLVLPTLVKAAENLKNRDIKQHYLHYLSFFPCFASNHFRGNFIIDI